MNKPHAVVLNCKHLYRLQKLVGFVTYLCIIKRLCTNIPSHRTVFICLLYTVWLPRYSLTFRSTILLCDCNVSLCSKSIWFQNCFIIWSIMSFNKSYPEKYQLNDHYSQCRQQASLALWAFFSYHGHSADLSWAFHFKHKWIHVFFSNIF